MLEHAKGTFILLFQSSSKKQLQVSQQVQFLLFCLSQPQKYYRYGLNSEEHSQSEGSTQI